MSSLKTLGIDLGTSSVKLLLMEADGRIVKTVSGSYDLFFPHSGWSEQNPEDWFRVTKECIREIMAGIPKEDVKAISFGGQMHGLVLLDESDRVLRPAILWNDGRTEEESRELNEVYGRERLEKDTGNMSFAGFTAPKILWVKRHEKEIFDKIRSILLPKDYLAFCFTGVKATDPSDASGTLYYDPRKGVWSKDMLDYLGIEESFLPEIHYGYEVIGKLRATVAEETGLSKETLVTIGAGDNAAGAVGTGAVGSGKLMLSLGTSGTLFYTMDHFPELSNRAIHAFRHTDGSFHLLACMLSAASAYDWWMKDILLDSDFRKDQEGMTELGRNSVFFAPYLMGERSPHNNAFARAAFFGMSRDTTRKDFSQAVMEGVAFGLKSSYKIAREAGERPKAARLSGGGAKSPVWRRMMASIFDLPMERVASEEGPSYGAAMLAAVGAGYYKTVEEAANAITRVVETVEPEKELVKLYEEQFAFFEELYPAMKDLYDKLRERQI